MLQLQITSAFYKFNISAKKEFCILEVGFIIIYH